MTEMINVPASIPPTLRPYVSAMLHGLWGWVTRPLQVIVKAGVPDALGEEPQSAAALAAVTGCDADVSGASSNWVNCSRRPVFG